MTVHDHRRQADRLAVIKAGLELSVRVLEQYEHAVVFFPMRSIGRLSNLTVARIGS